uniref:Uncharacterized protein n=1 Tax=Oryza rufipogon TaxID=4529 RepID=A0A0E0PIU4_ORYRU
MAMTTAHGTLPPPSVTAVELVPLPAPSPSLPVTDFEEFSPICLSTQPAFLLPDAFSQFFSFAACPTLYGVHVHTFACVFAADLLQCMCSAFVHRVCMFFKWNVVLHVSDLDHPHELEGKNSDIGMDHCKFAMQSRNHCIHGGRSMSCLDRS